jgi:hypothetical protein
MGKNVLIEVALMKYEDRLPHKKIKSTLKRRHGLSISTATVFLPDFQVLKGGLEPFCRVQNITSAL